jgi:aconitase B
MRSNVTLMKWMIAEGYQDARTLKRRIAAMEEWIANGTLLEADANAQHAAVIEIDLAEVTEPTRNFPNRLGIDTQVYLGSAELAAMCALLGKIPSKEEYMQYIQVVNAKAADIYRYMNFDQIPAFVEVAETVEA